MPKFGKDSKLSTIIFHEPDILTLLNRFGIYLGVGDDSVEDVARNVGISEDLLLTLINTYLNDDYFPEETLRGFSLSDIVGYLSKTDMYWKEFQLPNVERHFSSLVARSDSSENISLLRRFFSEMANELSMKINHDIDTVFPMILDMAKNNVKCSENKSIAILENLSNDAIEEKLGDLLSFFIIHLSGKYDRNLCRAVVSAVFTLDKDVKQDNRIRKRILLPLLKNNIV